MRPLLRFLAALTALAMVFLIVSAIVDSQTPPMPAHPFFRADDDLLVMAHQGGNLERPGNTLIAFENAAALGVDVLEMDIHSTRDGVLVVIHDDTIDRTTDGSGRVDAFTFEELQAFDAGYRWVPPEQRDNPEDEHTYPYRGQGVTIPALKDVLEAFPAYRMTIEMKPQTPSLARPLCDLLREHDMTDLALVASFHGEPLRDFRQVCPEVATSAYQDEIVPFFALNLVGLGRAYAPVSHAFQVPTSFSGLDVVTPGFIDGAHYHNIDVHVWTINDGETMREMIDVGVDGIITDRPTLLLDLLGRAPDV